MPFDVVTLDDARRALAVGQTRFEQMYPGVFLLAIGLLRARPLEDAPPDAPAGTREYPALDLETTLSMSFGERLTHAMQDHALAGCTFFLRREQVGVEQLVGRKVGSDLTVPDPSVSDRHCTVVLGEPPDRLVVVDLGSTNGTAVDKRRLEQGRAVELHDEEMLTVGRYGFQLLLPSTLYRALLELASPD